MLDPKVLDELAQKLSQAMPTGVKTLQDDLDKNLRAALTAALAKLDLVTREEFDVQTQVLARTRAKLEAMQQRVAELERQVLGKPPAAAEDANSTNDDMDGG